MKNLYVEICNLSKKHAKILKSFPYQLADRCCKELAESNVLQNVEGVVESVVFIEVELREQSLPAKMPCGTSPGVL